MANIPRHVLLRELGGSVSFVPHKRRRLKDGLKSHNQELHSSDYLSNEYFTMTSKNENISVEHDGSYFSSHPRINSNTVRHSYKILKDLISSDYRRFSPVNKEKHPIVSEGAALGVTYADGKMFIRNKLDKTYDCFAVRERNKKLYSLPMYPKWEDVTIVAHSTSNTLSKPVIIILRKGNTVHIHDLETGDSTNEISLNTSNYVPFNIHKLESSSHNSRSANNEFYDQNNATFKEIFYDIETSQVCVKSTRNPKSSDILVSFILFSYPDTKHLTNVNIRRSVFGSSITDAEIFQDVVMVMVSGSLTRLYSLQSLLNYEIPREQIDTATSLPKCSLFHKKQTSLQKVITNEKLPCLYDIKSFQHNVQLSPISGMKTIVIGLNDHNFKLLNLRDNSLVSDGMVGMRDPEGINHFRFHPDDSPRLIYLHPPHLSVYEVKGNDNDNLKAEGVVYKVHKTFDFQVIDTDNQLKLPKSNLSNPYFEDCYRLVSERDIINFHSTRSKENKELTDSNESPTECYDCC